MSPTGLMGILYCLYFWDSPNLNGQVPVFISFGNRVAQLYSQALVTAPFEVEVNLQTMVSQPVCLEVGLPSEAHDKIFLSVWQLRVS
jgi:hypothetical protein